MCWVHRIRRAHLSLAVRPLTNTNTPPTTTTNKTNDNNVVRAYQPLSGKGLWGAECTLAVIGTGGPANCNKSALSALKSRAYYQTLSTVWPRSTTRKLYLSGIRRVLYLTTAGAQRGGLRVIHCSGGALVVRVRAVRHTVHRVPRVHTDHLVEEVAGAGAGAAGSRTGGTARPLPRLEVQEARARSPRGGAQGLALAD
eukprot:5663434-Pyramimonas_sp.AAC.2